ncbi:MAG: hypothetical protein RR202_04775 [Bacteroidales bacterium]
MKKMPPIEKIPEAYSAIADGRVAIDEGDEKANVSSSDRSKGYIVGWKDGIYSSNDNASYWQGTVGYPIIGVLLLQGKLPLDDAIVTLFRDINWKEINARHKNNYHLALAEIYAGLEAKGVDVEAIKKNIQAVYENLERLQIKIKRSSLRPPIARKKQAEE